MTQWTQENYQELSKNVADKFVIPAYYTAPATMNKNAVWLHSNWAFIMEKCVKSGIWASYSRTQVVVFSGNDMPIEQKYKDHNNDKSLAERVARMLALLEVTL